MFILINSTTSRIHKICTDASFVNIMQLTKSGRRKLTSNYTQLAKAGVYAKAEVSDRFRNLNIG